MPLPSWAGGIARGRRYSFPDAGSAYGDHPPWVGHPFFFDEDSMTHRLIGVVTMIHTHLCRSGRHVIHGPQDRRPNGGCKGCALENEARYRRSCQDARKYLKEMQIA